MCSGLTSVTIPNSIITIRPLVFAGCRGLTSVTIPNSVTSIEQGAFSNCSGLTSINIPSSVTSINESAFFGCSGLTSINIPNSVTSIERKTFEGCIGITSVTIPNSITSIGDGAFEGCSGLTSVTIPNTVTSIGRLAFSNCSGLTSVTIPNSVTNIGEGIFNGCENIKNTIIVNDSFVFLPKGYEGHYSIPNNINNIIGYAFNDCGSLTSVTIPNSVTSIGSGAFNGCCGLTSVTIPNSITKIEPSTFCGCRGLTSVTIPNSVTRIGEYSFYECKGLTSFTIPNSVTSIGDNAFYGCSGLTCVTIPNSVTSIGSCAFSECFRVEKLNYNCSVNPNGYFNSLKELYIGDNVTIVYDYFKDSPINKVVLGKSVSNIRTEAFKDSQIEEFTITGEEPPYLYPNVFGSQDLSNATLYVPESKTEYYQTTEPWSKFGKILTLSGETPSEPEKCATPSISFLDGKLQFTCETEGAECYYTLNSPDVRTGETFAEGNNVTLYACYDITFYAKAEGFVNSDVATAKLYWLPSKSSETDNINTAAMRGIAIQSAGGFINISGLDTNERVDFYATDGKTLGSATAINGSVSFSAQQGTIIIAKFGKESVKIAVE